MLKALLSQTDASGTKPNERSVRRAVFIGTPHYGTPKATRGLLDGLPVADLASLLHLPDVIDERLLSFNKEAVLAYAARNSPASYQLLPSEPLLTLHGPHLAVRQPLGIVTAARAPLIAPLPALLRYVDRPIGTHDEFKRELSTGTWDHKRCRFCPAAARDVCTTEQESLNHAGVGEWTLPHDARARGGRGWDIWAPDQSSGLDAYVIYGQEPSPRTFGRIVIERSDGHASVRGVEWSRGDRTVLSESGGAFATPYFDDDRRFEFDHEHLALVQASDVQDCVLGLLAEAPTPCAAAAARSRGEPRAARLQSDASADLEAQLDGMTADLLAEDGAGRRTGVAADGSVLTEIPDSRADRFSESQLVLVPADGDLSIRVRARITGTVRLRVRLLHDGRSHRELHYEFALTAGGQALIGIDSPITSAPADVDFDGDGAVDETQPPLDPPVADTGTDQVVAAGALVQLDGSASSEALGADLTYTWAQLTGPPVALIGGDSAMPHFVAPSANEPTAVVFGLQVAAGSEASRVATTSVLIRPCTTEVCNGSDDDCDGQIDEGNPGGNVACDTGRAEPCQVGITTCTAGAVACVASAQSCDATTCASDADCDDGLFCTGVERCFGSRVCLPGEAPCSAACQQCDEAADSCVALPGCEPETGCGADASPPPQLELDAASQHDFGSVPVGQVAHYMVGVANIGCGTLDVAINSPCAAFRADPANFQLTHGASVMVDAIFAPPASGSFGCPLHIDTSAGNATIEVEGVGSLSPTTTAVTNTVTPTTTPTPEATPSPPRATASHTPPPTATASARSTGSPTPIPCSGDCNRDDMVDTAELEIGIQMIFGRPVSCPAFDSDGNGFVRANDLTAALVARASRCGGR